MKIRNVKTILAGVLAVTMAVLMCSCNISTTRLTTCVAVSQEPEKA